MADPNRAQDLAKAYERGILPPNVARDYEKAMSKGLVKSAKPNYSPEHLKAAEGFGMDPSRLGRNENGGWYEKPDPEIAAPNDAQRQYLSEEQAVIKSPLDAQRRDRNANVANAMAKPMPFMSNKDGSLSQAGAAITSLGNGGSLGWGDELGDKITGMPQVGEQLRSNLAEARTNYPVTSFASEMAGGASLPVANIMRGASLGKRAVNGIANGAFAGGIYGAGEAEGDIHDRLEGGAEGAAFGAGAGALLPVGAAGVVAGSRPARNALGEAAARLKDKVFGTQATQAYNDKVAVEAVKRSMERSGMSYDDVLKAIDDFGDKPVILADVIGQDAVNALTALTRKAGTTSQKAQALIEERFQGFNQRAQDDLQAATGIDRDVIGGNIDNMMQARQAKAAPLYDALFQDFADVQPENLNAAVQANPVLREYAKKASKSLASDVSLQGQQVPPIRLWDEAKRLIDADLTQATKKSEAATDLGGIRRLTQLKDFITTELDELTQGQYAQVREAGGEAPRLRQAMRDGKQALSARNTADDIRGQVAKLNDQDVVGYQAGLAGDISTKIDRNMTPQRFRVPETQNKLRAGFGEDAGSDFLNRMESESKLRELSARYGPRMNSVTGTVLENGENQLLNDGVQAAANLATGNKVGLMQQAVAFMRRQGYSEAQMNAMGDLLLSNPREGLRRLGLDVPTPQTPTSTNAFGPRPQAARPPVQSETNALANMPQVKPQAPPQNPLSTIAPKPREIPARPQAIAPTAPNRAVEGRVNQPARPSQADIGESKQWVAAREKGLDMSPEARMQRAREQGFDVDNVMYRGLQERESGSLNINTMEPKGIDDNIHMSSSASNASDYADDFGEGANGAVYPLVTRGNIFDYTNPKHFEQVREALIAKHGDKNHPRVKRFEKMAQNVLSPANRDPWASVENYLDDIKTAGFAGAQNIENGNRNLAMFDPQNVRSPNAAFDPANRFKDDLSGGVSAGVAGNLASGGLGGVAGYNADPNASEAERWRNAGIGAAAGVGGLNALKRMDAAAIRRGIDPELGELTVSRAKSDGYKGADIGEADEWVAARNKGLDMSQESRMQRAKEMGFDTDTVLYHSTVSDIKEFDSTLQELGTHVGTIKTATNRISDLTKRGRMRTDEGANTMPIFTKGNFVGVPDLMKFDTADNYFQARRRENAWRTWAAPRKYLKELDGLASSVFDAQNFGDGVDAKEARDMWSNGVREISKKHGIDGWRYVNKAEKGGKSFVIFDPSNIRSVNAAFDPDNKFSSNISGGVNPSMAGNAASMAAGGTAGYYADPNATAEERMRNAAIGAAGGASLAFQARNAARARAADGGRNRPLSEFWGDESGSFPGPQSTLAKNEAQQLGFNTDKVYYHGTKADFDDFATSTGLQGKGVYAGEERIARRYADGGRLIPLYVKGDFADMVDAGKAKSALAEKTGRIPTDDQINKELARHGFTHREGQFGSIVIFDPKNIAQVDPDLQQVYLPSGKSTENVVTTPTHEWSKAAQIPRSNTSSKIGIDSIKNALSENSVNPVLLSKSNFINAVSKEAGLTNIKTLEQLVDALEGVENSDAIIKGVMNKHRRYR